MNRRDFIAGLGGASATWPVVARAQQPVPVVGFLGGSSLDERVPLIAALRRGLAETGFVEGQQFRIPLGGGPL
jgi:putative ABC transport system substrate-binding protein